MPACAQAIVGGTTPNRPWPAQGYLEVVIPLGPDRVCGGTLVSGRWFLTAGHCVTDRAPAAPNVLDPTAFTVSLGKADTTQFAAADRFGVDRVLRDPLFNRRPGGTSSHDLALLHLSTGPPLAPRFLPMQIVTAAEAGLWSPGTVATIIGWGATFAGGPLTPQLQQAGVPILGDGTCTSAYPSSDPNPFDLASMLCAGDGSADTCTGDSGGPLMVPRVDDFALAAVTSYGMDCGNPARPGVYARAGAQSLNDWVRAQIPTASFTITPARPDPGDDVNLLASGTQPEPGLRAYAWDLDDDGSFDDATGDFVILQRMPAGSTVVRVQESYADGDRAVAREVVTTAGSPLPQPPPPPPPPPRPAPPTTPATAPGAAPAPAAASDIPPSPPALPAFARLLPGARSAHLYSLFDRLITVRVRCSAPCTLNARLVLDGRTAKRVGLSRRASSTLIGTGARRLRRKGTSALAIHLTRRGARALHRAAGGTMRLRITARAGTRLQKLERTIALRR